MPTLVQKVTVSLQPDVLKTIDKLQKRLKYKSRSAVIDYLVRTEKKKAYYAEVHRQAQIDASDAEYQSKKSDFAAVVSRNAIDSIIEDDGEDYSTW